MRILAATIALVVSGQALAGDPPGHKSCLLIQLEILGLDEHIRQEAKSLRQREAFERERPNSYRSGMFEDWRENIRALKARRKTLAQSMKRPGMLQAAAAQMETSAPPMYENGAEIPRAWSELVTGLQFIEWNATPEERSAIAANPIGMIDGDVNNHALRVGRILAPAKSPIERTVQYFGEKVKPSKKEKGLDLNTIDLGLDHFLSQEHPPSVINLSMGGVISRDKIQKLAERGVIVVKSGGNRGGESRSKEIPGELRTGAAVDFMIAAGATESVGLSNKHGTIPGPHITTYSLGAHVYSDAALKPEHLDMTSSAAPQVARAIANIKAILPALTVDQARTLLSKTNLRGPDVGTYDSKTYTMSYHREPAGLMNAWKAWKVARRLRELPNERWNEALASDWIYDFGAERESLISNAEAESDPESKYNLLQQAFLLQPTPELANKILAHLRAQPHRYPVMELYYGHYFSKESGPGPNSNALWLLKSDPELRVVALRGILSDPHDIMVDQAFDELAKLDLTAEERKLVLQELDWYTETRPNTSRGTHLSQRARALREYLLGAEARKAEAQRWGNAISEPPIDAMGAEFREIFGRFLAEHHAAPDNLSALSSELMNERYALAKRNNTLFAQQMDATATPENGWERRWQLRRRGGSDQSCWSFGVKGMGRLDDIAKTFEKGLNPADATTEMIDGHIFDGLPGDAEPTVHPTRVWRYHGLGFDFALYQPGNRAYYVEHPNDRAVPKILATLDSLWKRAQDPTRSVEARMTTIAEFEWLWFWTNPYFRSGALSGDAFSFLLQKKLASEGAPISIRTTYKNLDLDAFVTPLEKYVDKRKREMQQGNGP